MADQPKSLRPFAKRRMAVNFNKRVQFSPLSILFAELDNQRRAYARLATLGLLLALQCCAVLMLSRMKLRCPWKHANRLPHEGRTSKCRRQLREKVAQASTVSFN